MESIKMPVYLELFHGRKKNEQLEDWGTQGPILGPFAHVQTTYGLHIKCGEVKTGDLELELDLKEDMVLYKQIYYGDWSVFGHEIMEAHPELKKRLVTHEHTYRWTGKEPCSGMYCCVHCGKPEDETTFNGKKKGE